MTVRRSLPRLLLSLVSALVVIRSAPAQAQGSWHPVRVYHGPDGWPHFFEVWNPDVGGYEHRILTGYQNISFGDDGTNKQAFLDRLANSRANFVRMWLRPSDGMYAFLIGEPGDPYVKVDLNWRNPDFFDRLNTILNLAEQRGIVIEVMLWDRNTGWRGGRLDRPTNWETCWATSSNCQNVHHPLNNVQALPSLSFEDDNQVSVDTGFYDMSDPYWVAHQQQYMT